MPHTLDDIRALGYEVGIAFGGTQIERDRLAEMEAAKAKAPVEAELEAAIANVEATIAILQADRPEGAEVDEIDQALLERLTGLRLNLQAVRSLGDAIEHQKRAVEVAAQMPTVYVISGFGILTYVNFADDDGAPLDADAEAAVASYCDPVLYVERCFVRDHPEACQARRELRELGYEVERPDPLEDVFDVTDPVKDAVIAAEQTPPDLPPLAETLPPVEETTPATP